MGMDAVKWQVRRAAVKAAVATGALPPLPLNDERSWAVMGDMQAAATAAGTAEAPAAPAADAHASDGDGEQAALPAASLGRCAGSSDGTGGDPLGGDGVDRSPATMGVAASGADTYSSGAYGGGATEPEGGVTPSDGGSAHAPLPAGCATSNGAYDGGGGAGRPLGDAPAAAAAAAELRQRRQRPL